ncbi:MAG: hypothetical protein HY914_21570 [Desulfomonile tiedjei]|nr:hypothetical protein [Desulfomonile tiedjei]
MRIWIRRTPLAFMIPVIAGSTPQAVILRKVLKPRRFGVFFGAVTSGITAVGDAFNMVL